MFEYARPVRWSDVDAAGLVFFPRFLEYCHDAIEAMFAPIEGGYPHLTQRRKVGVPTVSISVDYSAPLRYGDVCRVQSQVVRLGRSAIQMAHTLVREHDHTVCARVSHTVSVCDLSDPANVRSIPMPDDVRAIFAPHLPAP